MQTKNDGDSSNHVDEVLKHSRALKSEASGLYSELHAAAEQMGRSLDIKGRMERNPYQTMAVAAGVGYLLGGGLFSNFTGKMLRLSTRMVLLPFLKNQLAALGEAAASGAMGVSGKSGLHQGYVGAEDGNGGF